MKSLLYKIIQHYQANLRAEGGYLDMFETGSYNAHAVQKLERAERILRRYEAKIERARKSKLETIREDTSFCGNEQW